MTQKLHLSRNGQTMVVRTISILTPILEKCDAQILRASLSYLNVPDAMSKVNEVEPPMYILLAIN